MIKHRKEQQDKKERSL